MFKSGSAVVVVMLALTWGAAVSGCRMEEQRGPASPDRQNEKTSLSSAVKAKTLGSAFIPDSVLAERGLESLWTKKNNEGAFRSAYLLPDGIFAVTRPQSDGRGGRLIRYKLSDGLPLWYYDLDEPLEHAPAAFHYGPSAEASRPDELYILQKDVVRCLGLSHGEEMWRVQLPFPVSCGPVVDENQYYIGSYDRRIYAMPKKRDLVSWTYITGGEIKSPGEIGPGGQVYFTSTDKGVYKLEGSQGWVNGKSWQFATGGRIIGSPVFFSRWVLAGSGDFKLYCFEIDGTRTWEFPAQAAVIDTPVVMSFRPDKPMVFCISQDDRRGDESRTLWAIDARSGSEMWRRPQVAQVVGLGRRAAYLLADTRREGGSRRIVAADALKGEELFTLPVESFDIIPTNDAEHGTNPKQRGVIYLISRAGHMQALREKP